MRLRREGTNHSLCQVAAAALVLLLLGNRSAWAQRPWSTLEVDRTESAAKSTHQRVSSRSILLPQEQLPPTTESPGSQPWASETIPSHSPSTPAAATIGWKRATGHVMWPAPGAHWFEPEEPFDPNCPQPYPSFHVGDGRRARALTGWLSNIRFPPSLRSDWPVVSEPGTYPVEVFKKPEASTPGQSVPPSPPTTTRRPQSPRGFR